MHSILDSEFTVNAASLVQRFNEAQRALHEGGVAFAAERTELALAQGWTRIGSGQGRVNPFAPALLGYEPVLGMGGPPAPMETSAALGGAVPAPAAEGFRLLPPRHLSRPCLHLAPK